MNISIEQWANAFEYNPNTGEFKRRETPRSAFKSDKAWKISSTKANGKKAGTLTKAGYVLLTMAGQKCYAHRLALAISDNRWPENEVDHINGDPSDNRLCNLRHASRQQNGRNIKLRDDNKSGVSGVRWNKREQKWKAQISVDGIVMGLGAFSEFDLAVKARREAELKFHKEFSPSFCR